MKPIALSILVVTLLTSSAFAQSRHDPRTVFMWLDWDAVHRIRISHCSRIAPSAVSDLDAEYAKWREKNQPALESLHAIARQQLKLEGRSDADVESAVLSMKKETSAPYLAALAEGPADPEEKKRWEAELNKACTAVGYALELAQPGLNFVEFLSEVQASTSRRR